MTSENQIEKYDETLNSVSGTLLSYAETVEDEDIAARIMDLSALTTPSIKGIEGPQRAKIPYIAMRQGTSTSTTIPEETAVGQLYTSLSDHVGDRFDFIPIYVHNIRKKWGDEKIDCQSIDGVKGSKYGACKECPYGQFEKGTRPDCSSGTSYYVVSEDLTSIFNIEFTKSNAKAGRMIKQLALPPSMWSRVYSLSSKNVKGNKQNYYEYVVTATNRRPGEVVVKLCDILHDYFQSNYKKALLLRDEFQARLQASNSEGGAAGNADGNDPAVEVADNEIDFSGAV